MQKKTKWSVPFEIMTEARQILLKWLNGRGAMKNLIQVRAPDNAFRRASGISPLQSSQCFSPSPASIRIRASFTALAKFALPDH